MLFQKLLGTNATDEAIQYVGGYVQGFAGTTSNTTISLTSLTGGLASAPAAGDIVIVYFATGSNTNRNLVVAGYQEIYELSSGSSNVSNLVVACKTMGATPDTSLVLTGGTLNTADAGTIAVQVFRNVTNPLPGFTFNTNGNTTQPNPPSITPFVNNSVVVAGGAQQSTSGSNTFTSSDLTNFITVTQSDSYRSTIGMGYKDLASGSFNPAVFGGGNTGPGEAVTLALSKLYSASGYIANNTASSNNESVALLLPRPNGTQPGDLMVAVVIRDTSSNTTGIPTGWTRQRDILGGVIATKIATSTENGFYDFSVPAGTAPDAISGTILSFRNFDVDVVGSATTGSTLTLAATSISPSISESIVLGIYVQNTSGNATQNSYFSNTKLVSRSGTPPYTVFTKTGVAAGATGSVTFTGENLDSKGVVLLSLKPI